MSLIGDVPDGGSICCQGEREEKLCGVVGALHPRLEQDVSRVPQRVVETLEGHQRAGVAGRGEHLDNADVAVLQHNLPLQRLPLLVVVEDQSLHGVGPPLDEIDVPAVLKLSGLQGLAAKAQTPDRSAVPLRLAIWEDLADIGDLLADRVVQLEEDKSPSGVRLPLLLSLVLLHEDGELWLLLEGGGNRGNEVVRPLPQAFAGVAGHRSERAALPVSVFSPPETERVRLQAEVFLNRSLCCI